MHSSDAFIPQYGEVVTTAFGFRPNAKRYKSWSPKRNAMSAASFASNFTGQHYRRQSQESEESLRSKNRDHGRRRIIVRSKRRHWLHPSQRVAIEATSCDANSARFAKSINVSKRAHNEKKFEHWTELPNGGRQYWYEVPGRYDWKARYLKEVDAAERTLRVWQEILDDKGEIVEVHVKYRVDSGHHKP